MCLLGHVSLNKEKLKKSNEKVRYSPFIQANTSTSPPMKLEKTKIILAHIMFNPSHVIYSFVLVFLYIYYTYNRLNKDVHMTTISSKELKKIIEKDG